MHKIKNAIHVIKMHSYSESTQKSTIYIRVIEAFKTLKMLNHPNITK